MSTLDRALQIAARAHEGQLDREGRPYILHSMRVMCSVDGADAQIAAALHDVVEDTSVTLDDLRAEGFAADVLEAIAILTHHRDEPYVDYVVRCKAHPIARSVKLADLQDNCRLPRLLLRADREPGDIARIRRYVLSFQFLSDRLDEATYRARMSEG